MLWLPRDPANLEGRHLRERRSPTCRYGQASERHGRLGIRDALARLVVIETRHAGHQSSARKN